MTTEIKTETHLSNEQVVAGALAWVNTMRAEHNLPALQQLPRGRHYDVGDCALARALAPTSDGSCPLPFSRRYRAEGPMGARWTYAMGGQVVRVSAPAVVGEFIYRFDLGQLDHLLS